MVEQDVIYDSSFDNGGRDGCIEGGSPHVEMVEVVP